MAIPERGASGVLGDDRRTLRRLGAAAGGRQAAIRLRAIQPAGAQVPHRVRPTLSPGNHVVRFEFKYDGGGVGKGGDRHAVRGREAGREGRIPQTIPHRFSLDETFDIGEDTGTPVVEDYVDKMPFAFTGTLKRLLVVLEPEKLTAEERKALLEQEAAGSMAAQ